MGISTEYREFKTREGYDQFFQEVRAAGPNHVDMFVPPIDKSRGGKLMKTYIVHPDIDFKLLDFVVSQPQYDGRWVIRPVENLQEYRDNTDKRSYRVALRKPQVIDYRRLMTRENVFMPFLVFDAQRHLWISGRHRAEASKSAYGALYALVMEDMTDEESLYITDITNQWHQESWTEDERALLALEYMLQNQMTERQALEHVQLDPKSTSPILGAMLYRWHKQGPHDRRLIESHQVGQGGGRPFTLKTLGERVKVFSQDAIKTFSIERWVYLNESEARLVLGLIRSRTNSEGRGDYYSQLFVKANFNPEDWKPKGSPEERWKQFSALVQVIRQVKTEKKEGVSGPTDDRVWMNFVFKYTATDDSGLISIKRELSESERMQSTTLVDRLDRIFGS